MNAGYTQTETGLIPQDWEVKQLGQVVAKARLGGNYANQDAETALPLMKMGNIDRGSFDVSKLQYIKAGVHPDDAHVLTAGDVIFNTRNTLDLVGKVAMWRDELPVAYYNSNLLRLEFDEAVICSPVFANYALNTASTITALRARATGTTSVAAIYTRDLMSLPIIVPPPNEQIQIARALGDVDDLVVVLDRLIAKKRDLKQAAMQQLLTGQTRLLGFDGACRETTLGETVSFLSGGTPSRSNEGYWSGDIPWISASSLRTFYIWRSESNVTKEAVSKGSKMAPVESTLLLVRGSALHNEILAGLVTKPVCFNQDVKALVPKPDLSPVFLTHLLLGRSNDLLKLVTSAGNTAGVLDTKQLKELAIRMPSLDEQTAIATVLSDMDAEIEALERRRDKTRALKQGMLQELLTGRTRLV